MLCRQHSELQSRESSLQERLAGQQASTSAEQQLAHAKATLARLQADVQAMSVRTQLCADIQWPHHPAALPCPEMLACIFQYKLLQETCSASNPGTTCISIILSQAVILWMIRQQAAVLATAAIHYPRLLRTLTGPPLMPASRSFIPRTALISRIQHPMTVCMCCACVEWAVLQPVPLLQLRPDPHILGRSISC